MYDAQTNTVNIDDITTNEQNRKVLRRLSNNNAADFNEELIQNLWIRDVDEDDNDYLPEGAHDMGWLGYFIGRCDYLQKLYIREFDDYSIDVLEPFFRGVQLNKSIQVIDFEDIDLFEGKIFTMLTPFLKNNTSLASIAIDNCEFGDEGCRYLALALAMGACKSSCTPFLKNNTNLTSLTIEGCNFGDRGSRLLALAIGACESLSDVELPNNNIADDELVDIITALSIQRQLKNLILAGNAMNKNGCVSLSTLLRCSVTELQFLNLWGNEINDEGIEILVPALANCNHLKILYLGRNHSVTTKGWRRLASILEAPDCNLEDLSVANNNIDDEAAATFASVLTNNQTLRSLNLYGNPLSAKGWQSFFKLLCNTSSVNATFLSNHTLRYTHANQNADAIDGSSMLRLNQRNNKKEIAIIKILQHHVDFDMMPFFEWEFKVLPLMINWFDRASTITMPDDFEPDIDIGPRKLSSIYQFVRGMPVLYVEARLRKELEDIKAMESQMEEEFRERKRALEERKKSIMERLGQQAKV